MKIEQGQNLKMEEVAALAQMLWPGHTTEELEEELSPLIGGPNAALFLAREGEEAVGFAQCQLRFDYVEGTCTSPVGYLEGIFVKEAFRRQGVAKALLSACEAWAKSKGCTEFASDAALPNHISHAFHLGAGFQEKNRIVCYAKKL